MISLIESGARDVKIDQLKSIARALEVPLEVLVFLGADDSDLEKINPKLRHALSEAVMTLIRA